MQVSKSIELTINNAEEIQLLSNVAELARRYICLKKRDTNQIRMVDEYEIGRIDEFLQTIFDATS